MDTNVDSGEVRAAAEGSLPGRLEVVMELHW